MTYPLQGNYGINEFDVESRRIQVRAFVVREDGLAREVIRVGIAPPPSHVMLLIDDSQAADRSIQFLRTAAAAFIKGEPHSTSDDLLFNAAGQPELVWTQESIQHCGQWLLVLGSLWLPLFGISLLCAVTLAASRWHLGAPATPAAPAAPGELRYDAFISYRHGADSNFARNLVDELEQAGYRIAIDERDFRAEQSFLKEMERCIRESRFTLALISGRFMDSGNTEEEALITKVLDMGERKRRLVPLILQRVEMPVWMYGIVGIDFTATNGMVKPLDKLKATLGEPLAKVGQE
jgi:hypothetical protein